MRATSWDPQTVEETVPTAEAKPLPVYSRSVRRRIAAQRAGRDMELRKKIARELRKDDEVRT